MNWQSADVDDIARYCQQNKRTYSCENCGSPVIISHGMNCVKNRRGSGNPVSYWCKCNKNKEVSK